ncbi:fimbrial-like protein YfcQ [Escherichia coli]|nr:fimbrial-like protein YfcQ [Escherichia coli]
MKRLAWCLIYGFAGLAQAAINDVTFHGTLVSPPACTISDGKTIEVEFRNVIIDNINGDNFRQDVPYTITCDPDVRDDAWEMSLTWTGSQPLMMIPPLKRTLAAWGLSYSKTASRLSWEHR